MPIEVEVPSSILGNEFFFYTVFIFIYNNIFYDIFIKKVYVICRVGTLCTVGMSHVIIIINILTDIVLLTKSQMGRKITPLLNHIICVCGDFILYYDNAHTQKYISSCLSLSLIITSITSMLLLHIFIYIYIFWQLYCIVFAFIAV